MAVVLADLWPYNSAPVSRSPQNPAEPWRASPSRERFVIGLVSFSLVLFEVAATWLASAVLFYHFVFLVLSMAMLGLSAPGVWFAARRPGPRSLPWALAIAGVSLPMAVIVLFQVGARMERVGDEMGGLQWLAFGATLVPFLALGSAICLLLMRAKGNKIGRMYRADLVGSTLGAAVVVPLAMTLPAPVLVVLAGVAPLVGLALLYPRYRAGAGLVIVLVLGSLAVGDLYQLRFNRVYDETNPPLFESWTPTGRITVRPHGSGPTNIFGWGWGYNHQHRVDEQLIVEQEGGAGTPILRLPEWPADLDYLLDDVTTAGLQVERPERACIIGAGGGRDVLSALQAGATEVDAVELNPETIRAVSQVFADFSGNPYELPGVRAHAAEGRHFLTHSEGDYDVIMISLVDSWAATAAGAYALAENYLYTVEALQLYLDRVSDDGIVSITRWYGGVQRLEVTRLGLIALEALRRQGFTDPGSHLAVVRAETVATVLFSPVPFDTARLDRIDALSRERGFLVVWPPPSGVPVDGVAAILAATPSPSNLSGFDISVIDDDRPFFFQNVSPFGAVPDTIAGHSFNEKSTVILRSLIIVMGLLTALMLALGALGTRGRVHLGSLRGSLYFAAIGMAFMLVEVPLIQRFILYLGHPSFATTIVLSGLLLGAGVGAGFAGKLAPSTIVRWSLILPLGTLLATVTLGPIIATTLGLAAWMRVALSLALLLPLGFLMGFPFPYGMIRFGDAGKPWFWAVNGATSVLGSVLGLALAIEFGFTLVLITGALFYACACVLGRGEIASR